LPDPTLTSLLASGDPGAMVAALCVKSGQSEEDCEHKIEETQTQIQEHEQAAEIAQMHEKANDMRSAALAGAIAGCAGGLLTAGAGGLPDGAAGKATLLASGKVIETAQEYIKANAAAHGEDLDADITQHKDNAEAAGTAASHAYDGARDAKKLLDAAIDFFREYSSSKEQSQAAALYKS
jgi:outer membrane murein-binding lipoprotein Lpp